MHQYAGHVHSAIVLYQRTIHIQLYSVDQSQEPVAEEAPYPKEVAARYQLLVGSSLAGDDVDVDAIMVGAEEVQTTTPA